MPSTGARCGRPVAAIAPGQHTSGEGDEDVGDQIVGRGVGGIIAVDLEARGRTCDDPGAGEALGEEPDIRRLEPGIRTGQTQDRVAPGREADVLETRWAMRGVADDDPGMRAQIRRGGHVRVVAENPDQLAPRSAKPVFGGQVGEAAEGRADFEVGPGMGDGEHAPLRLLGQLQSMHRRLSPVLRTMQCCKGADRGQYTTPVREGREMQNYLEFEKGLAEIEGKAEELRALARKTPEMDVAQEAAGLDVKAAAMLDELYRTLDPWRKTQVARHPDRPHCRDYIDALFSEWTSLAGDRNFADDHAVMGGLARFNDRSVVVIGHEKGHDTKSRIARNFGMARPEGYRKAIRLMDLADRFGLPVVTLIDTPGAYPGKGAEERGQAEAIARSTEKCLGLGVPLVSVIIGEGGSGGAVACATGDRLAMLEHSIYSVISPEGCASILWKDAEKMREAATALRLTAQDLLGLGVIDRIVPEPRGGAQRDRDETVRRVGSAIADLLAEVSGRKPEALRRARRRKYLEMGSKSLVA